MHLPTIDSLTAAAVVIANAATDAVHVRFTSAVVARRRVSAANWSGLWYLLSSYAVINYAGRSLRAPAPTSKQGTFEMVDAVVGLGALHGSNV